MARSMAGNISFMWYLTPNSFVTQLAASDGPEPAAFMPCDQPFILNKVFSIAPVGALKACEPLISTMA